MKYFLNCVILLGVTLCIVTVCFSICFLQEHLRKSVAKFMANTHTSVNLMSQVYLTNEKRYNYTTPKSFLEQISLYFKLLNEKSRENLDRIEKLENGLTKLVSTSQQVSQYKRRRKTKKTKKPINSRIKFYS